MLELLHYNSFVTYQRSGRTLCRYVDVYMVALGSFCGGSAGNMKRMAKKGDIVKYRKRVVKLKQQFGKRERKRKTRSLECLRAFVLTVLSLCRRYPSLAITSIGRFPPVTT